MTYKDLIFWIIWIIWVLLAISSLVITKSSETAIFIINPIIIATIVILTICETKSEKVRHWLNKKIKL